MILRRVLPEPSASLDVEADGARAALIDWYAPAAGESLRINLVSTLDGRAAGDDGTSESLTTRLDRVILGVIRETAGTVLVGAQSVRTEGYRLPRHAQLAVLSASGDLSGHRLAPRDGAPPVLVLTTERRADAAHRGLDGIDHLVVPLPEHAGRIAVADALAALRDRGAAGIVCEGGPSLASQVLATGSVDELCLTTVPRLGGPGIPLLGAGASSVTTWSPRQLLIDESGAQYARWARRGP